MLDPSSCEDQLGARAESKGLLVRRGSPPPRDFRTRQCGEKDSNLRCVLISRRFTGALLQPLAYRRMAGRASPGGTGRSAPRKSLPPAGPPPIPGRAGLLTPGKIQGASRSGPATVAGWHPVGHHKGVHCSVLTAPRRGPFDREPHFFWVPRAGLSAASQTKRDLNPQHAALETAALPVELFAYVQLWCVGKGREREKPPYSAGERAASESPGHGIPEVFWWCQFGGPLSPVSIRPFT